MMAGLTTLRTSRRGGGPAQEPTAIKGGNSLHITNQQTLQDEYDWLASSSRDTAMGSLSAVNRRSLVLSPGRYDDILLLDTSYVDVVEQIPGTVFLTSPPVQDAGIDAQVFGGGKFARSSISSRVVDGADAELAANECAKDEFLIAGKTIIEATTLPGDITEGYVLCDDGTYLYAADVAGNLFRAPKSTGVWAAVAGVTVAYMWAVNSGTYAGRLIRYKSGDHVAFSDDYGATWTEATTDPVLGGAATFVQGWSFAHSANAMVLVEYGVGRFIFTSADGGVTWTKTYNATTEELSMDHFHCVGYHPATSTFVTATGDGAGDAHFLTSTDDGATWTVAYSINNLQPVTLLDYGHATDFLCASDRFANVYRFNVSTGATAPVITNWVHYQNAMYCFALGYYDGLYWACQWQGASTVGEPAICVSQDGLTWSVIGYLDEADAGIQTFGGVANGYLYATAKTKLDVYRLIRIKVPNLAVGAWAKIEPAMTNLYGSVNLSIGSTDASAWRTSDDPANVDYTVEASGGLFGTPYVKATKGASGEVMVRGALNGAYSTPKNGLTYAGRIWIKGLTSPYALMHYFSFSGTAGLTAYSSCLLNTTDWVEILCSPITQVATGGTDTQIILSAKTVGDVGAENPEIHLGGWCLSSSRGGFQIGGTARTATRYAQIIEVGDAWTGIFGMIADVRSAAMGQYAAWSAAVTYADESWVVSGGVVYESIQAANLNKTPASETDWWTAVDNWCWHVATWRQDSDNYLILILDAIDLKFKLRIVVAGVLEETLTMAAAAYFEWKSQINFAVRVDNTYGAEKIVLTVNIGGDIEHLDSTDAEVTAAIADDNYMRLRQLTFIAGDMSILETGYAAIKVDTTSRGDMTTVPMWLGPLQNIPSMVSGSEVATILESGF